MTRLYKYQKAGVRMLKRLRLWAILADDMGLGKTIQVLTAIKKHLKKKGPILVICPATAKFTWEEQASEHAGMRVVLLNGRRPSRSVVRDMMRREHVMYVLSYNVLTAWRPYLEQMRPVLIVPDECQRLKSPFTKWTQAAMRLKAPHKIFTGGTGGIEKTPQDLWPILVMLRRADWPAWMRRLTRPTESAYNRFVHKFTVVRDTPWGKRPVEPRNMKKLHRFLKRYLLIRRRTKDVLKDLPPVQRMKVSMDLTSRRKYAEAENAAVLQMQMLMRDFKPAGQKDVKMKAIANGLLKKTSKLKLPAMKEWIDGFLEQTDEKLLCFGWNKFVVKGLQRKYGDAISVRVDGSVTGHKRRAALDRFNNDPTCRLAFMNIKSGGEAWSCRSAWNVAFLQVFPNPAAHNQAERRIRGVKRGVEGRPSRYHYLIAKDTAEERLLRKLRREQKTIDQAIDGGRTGGGIDLFEVVTGGRR